MKFIVVLAEGMSDEPIAELGGKTPLEAARTPNLDHMAARGILGLTRTIPAGMPPGSDVGALSVLGYDPQRFPAGRAAFEAVGLGVELGPEDVAFRLNLVTLETPDGGVETMRDFAGGRPPTSEARELIAELGRALGREGLEFHAGAGYRHLLVWRHGERRMRTTAPYDVADKPVSGALPEGPGAEVLRELMARARGVLAEHPLCRERVARSERAANGIWLWGQGTRPALPTLAERFGVGGAVVADTPMVQGLGVLAGLARVGLPDAADTSFRARAESGLAALGERDLLLLHLEAADEAGHLGDPQTKVEAIERLDADAVGPLLEGLRGRPGEWRMLVMPDHPTPCGSRTHTADPVPFVVYVSGDDRKARGLSRGYGERDARDQGIFIPAGHTLLERLLRR